MFDNIGRNPDEEANRRRATSLFVTTGACSAAVGMLLGIGAYTAVQQLPPTIHTKLVMLEAPPEDLPTLPAAPPQKAPAGASAEPTAPDELVEQVHQLQDEVEAHVADAALAPGTPDGDDNGEPDGKVGGRVGGDPNGELCGGDGQLKCVRVFHHSDLQVKRRVDPGYPDAARDLALGEQRCLVTVFLGEDGVPYDASVERCPKVFHQASREAVLKWRWYPPKDGRTAIRAQTTLAITYRLD